MSADAAWRLAMGIGLVKIIIFFLYLIWAIFYGHYSIGSSLRNHNSGPHLLIVWHV